MQPFRKHTGKVAPLYRANVDTDQIIPKQFLKRVEKTGFGEFLFYDWFRDGEIELGPNPILVAGPNFGSGSSREHAVWALADYGFEAVIAPSFSDIFSGNAFKNGILTVVLPQEAIDRLMEVAIDHPISIDLENQTVTTPFQDRFTFEIDPFRKHCLLNGLDEVGLTLARQDAIGSFEAQARAERPFLASGVPA